MNIGTLSIDLIANVARLQADMDAIKRSVGGTMAEVARMTDLAKNAMAALGVSMSIGALMIWVRSAVDAGDTTKQLADKTGLAAEEVAGLQLAYQQAGLGSDGMSSSIAKLSKQMVEGNKAFDQLGVSTHNADGTLRGTKDVLYDVADAFQGLQGGAAKAALAQEIFGKSGADMLPLLNGGSEGLREMADMAERLGLVIDSDTAEAADKFNDTTELLGLGLQGVARQVAAQLLPTLNSLAGNFLESMTKGDNLRKVAEGLATAFWLLYTAGAVVVEVFSTAGKAIGGVAAAAVLALKGDFAGAKAALSSMMSDVKEGWANTAKTIASTWSDAGGATVAAMAGMVGAGRQLKLQTNEQEAASKAAAAEAKKHAEELRKLQEAGAAYVQGLQDKNDVAAQELALGRSLTESEKAQLDLEKKLRDGEILLTAEERRLAEQRIKHAAALEDEVKLSAELKRWMDATAQANVTAAEALGRTTDELQQQVNQQREANAVVGLSARQLDQRTAAQLRDLAAMRDRQAALADEIDWTGQLGEEWRKQAELLRERATLVEQGTAVREAKDASDEWKKTTDSIESGLTDALMRAFESGKGFAEAFKSTLVNAFKTMVLEPTVRAVFQQGSGGLLNLLGMGGKAGSAAGGGYFGAGAGQVAFSQFSTPLAIAAISYSVGKAVSGQFSLGGAWGTLANSLGAVGGLINRAFGMGDKKVKETGIVGTILGGDVNAQAYADWKQKGGWFRSDKSGTKLSELPAEQLAALNASGASVLAGAQSMAAALGMSQTNLEAVSFNLRVKLGNDEAANQAALEAAFASYENTLAFQLSGALAPFKQAGEDWADVLKRMSQLQMFTDQLNEFGGVFSRVSQLSVSAKEELLNFAGGIEAFIGKTQQFVSDYYSQNEQYGLAARDIKGQLAAIGITQDITSLAQMRALVEGVDVSTTAGREQLNALLDIAASFAPVGQYLEANGFTLASLAAQAPTKGLATNVLQDPEAKAGYAQSQADAAARQAAAAEGTTRSVNNMNDSLGGKIDTMTQAITDGFARLQADYLAQQYSN